MAKVRKRIWTNKDGIKTQSWVFDYIEPDTGRKVRGGSFRTRAEAEAKALKISSSINDKTYSKQGDDITLQSAADDFVNLHAELHCKPSTLKSYKAYLRNHILPFFKNKKLIDITPNRINEFISLKQKEGLSAKSINHCVVLMGSIFQKVIDEGFLIQNSPRKVKKLRLVHQEMRFLETCEIHAVLKAAEENYSDFYPLLLLAIMTGMRRGEILGLTWDKVNWKTRKINVIQSLYKGQFITPKTPTSIRKIDMSDKLAEVLEEWKKNCPKSEKNLIFPNSVGEFTDADNLIKRRFHQTLELAGIDKIRFHDLRHTYCSILIGQNVPIKYIQHQMGHSSIQVTMDRYGHIMPEVNEKGIQALNSVFND